MLSVALSFAMFGDTMRATSTGRRSNMRHLLRFANAWAVLTLMLALVAMWGSPAHAQSRYLLCAGAQPGVVPSDHEEEDGEESDEESDDGAQQAWCDTPQEMSSLML